jgi:hypothetical protein
MRTFKFEDLKVGDIIGYPFEDARNSRGECPFRRYRIPEDMAASVVVTSLSKKEDLNYSQKQWLKHAKEGTINANKDLIILCVDREYEYGFGIYRHDFTVYGVTFISRSFC